MDKITINAERLEMATPKTNDCPSATNMDAINVALSSVDTIVNVSMWGLGVFGLVIAILAFFGYTVIKAGAIKAAKNAADTEIKKWEAMRVKIADENDKIITNMQSATNKDAEEKKIDIPPESTVTSDD